MNGTTPSSLRAVPAVVLVLLGACDNGRVVVDLQVVEITLPQEGVYVGADTAPVALVEFGSYACPLCRRFATEVFPRIETRFVQPGVLKYRYVNLSPPGASKRGPALVRMPFTSGGIPLRAAVVFQYRNVGRELRCCPGHGGRVRRNR